MKNPCFKRFELISKNESLPLERTVKHLIKVDCRLEGDELQVENPQFLVDMDTVAVHGKYDGAITTKIGKYKP